MAWGMHGGHVCMAGGMCWGGMHEACMAVSMQGGRWGVHGVEGVCIGGGVCAGETATEERCKQPTGMHSCLTCFFTMYRKYTKSN